MNPLFKIVLYPLVKVVVENVIEYVNDINFFKEEPEIIIKPHDRSKWTTERNILVYVAYDDFLNSKKVLGIKLCTSKIHIGHILNELMDTTKAPETLRNKMYSVCKDESIKNIVNKDLKINDYFGHKIKIMIERNKLEEQNERFN